MQMENVFVWIETMYWHEFVNGKKDKLHGIVLNWLEFNYGNGIGIYGLYEFE